LLAERDRVRLVRVFAVEVVEGPDKGKRAVSTSEELTIGADAGTDLELTDPAVSRHHCALRATARGLEVRDLGSTNGTFAGGCELVRGYLGAGTRLKLGTTVIAVDLMADEIEQPLAAADAWFGLVGASGAMRRLYPILERYAQSDATVLITGETGTGKELVAEAIHRAGPRNHGPFIALNCGSLPPQLIESELFGHVRGAFTGAETDRVGAFEHAHGGTIFLDEIGELPPASQPVLLRVLENKKIKPLGSSTERAVDVRVVAATNRDLREAVNQRRLRSDLYYRLHVLPVELPPLRERDGDIALLADMFWRELRDAPAPPELIAVLARQRWEGNVRELRNAVERAALIGWAELPAPTWNYAETKDALIATWERDWLAQLIEAHGGNVAASARAARMARSYLRRLALRYGITQVDE